MFQGSRVRILCPTKCFLVIPLLPLVFDIARNSDAIRVMLNTLSEQFQVLTDGG